jgi:hypothetical protein
MGLGFGASEGADGVEFPLRLTLLFGFLRVAIEGSPGAERGGGLS